MNELIQKKWAAIYANNEFICVQTCSGFRRTAFDPKGALIFLSPNPELQELGHAVQEALAASRVLTPDEIGSFFDVSAIEQAYESWVSTMLEKFKYATRRDLFQNMRHCHVESSSGIISIRPTFHEKAEGWSGTGIEKSDYVLTQQTASAQELGQGALRALSKCVA